MILHSRVALVASGVAGCGVAGLRKKGSTGQSLWLTLSWRREAPGEFGDGEFSFPLSLCSEILLISDGSSHVPKQCKWFRQI